ncbi:MAG: Coproporphyrinogen-III oxidase [Candidatus Tokpelaia hoelldobleri]|uniref:Coproporphyrinogen-III oxidase n=1 Tax=Candidatus Tokpelaia hoelldobleri TaxID=1902579 RepID=A0A1U9JVP7_9HYPH|nr:MAG: Coproporphyrinogen-III oxidase [Candidatus Tokpelaia hoelldoblerii]
MEKATLLHYATMAVPRYTSYPTAVDFVALDDGQRIGWLRQIADGQAVSLYLHIPYCREICHYCGCFTKAVRRDDVIADYAAAIVRDIRLQAQYLQGRPRVVHLHWGGGTPSILPAENFTAIMAALREAFDFDGAVEQAVELDPRTVTPVLAATLAQIGVNRASLGVQDINRQVQEHIGRVQPVMMVERAVSHLRAVGIEDINFDLIYGLPLQTVQSLRETCETVGALRPSRIACYGYAHLPGRRANQKLIDESLLPDAFERYEQAATVGMSFKQQGFVEIGIDHFARPDDPMAVAMRKGRLHRNFQGYTDDKCPVLLGFGASAISEFPQGYAQTIADIGQYRRAVAAGNLATVRGIAVGAEDRLRAALIRDLMCGFAVDLAHYGGKARFASELAGLQPLIADGIATEKDGQITVPETSRPFVRIVAALFDTYRSSKPVRFSSAV